MTAGTLVLPESTTDENTSGDVLTEATAVDIQGGSLEQTELEERVAIVSHFLQAHGGGIELMPSSHPDVVRVKFTGLCTACCLRPLTTANIITPVLGAMEGVRKVEVDGVRISDETMADLTRP